MSRRDTLEAAVGDGLVVVDVQNDFLPGGSLAVPRGDEVLGPLNIWIARFAGAGLPIFATCDQHPPNHCSFRDQGGPWPPHCVAGTSGAEFAPALALPPDARRVAKATTPGADAYSGFEGTELASLLRQVGVRRLFVGGLATDYCVVNTVIDGLKAGFAVVLLIEAIRAVEVKAGDGERAIAAMVGAGAIPLGA